MGAHYMSKVTPDDWSYDPPEKFLGVAFFIGAFTFPLVISLAGTAQSFLWKDFAKLGSLSWRRKLFLAVAVLLSVHVFNYVLGWLMTFSIFL